MEEIFKDIKDYEGLYQVSNLGNVKSLPKGDGNGNRVRILKFDEGTRSDRVTYRRVTLSKNSKTKRYQVHRLVAQAFIPNSGNLPFVNHIDNDGTNNSVSNLEWCTQATNMKHSSDQGRQDSVKRLGGIAAGNIRRQKMLTLSKELIGQTFGQLTVIDTYIDTSLSKNRIKYICTCSCGNTTEKDKYKLTTGVQACKECTYKIRSQTRKQDEDIVSAV